jgi:hypothetical protein
MIITARKALEIIKITRWVQLVLMLLLVSSSDFREKIVSRKEKFH